MSISTPFIQRPVATSLFIAALVLVGLAAFPLLPVAPLPRVDFPTINVVNVKYPGASPETMASSVAQPLERQFAIIPSIAADDLDQRRGLGADHDPVRSRSQYRRCRGRRPGADQRRHMAAQLPKITAVCRPDLLERSIRIRSADLVILALSSPTAHRRSEVDDYADTVLAQQISVEASGQGQPCLHRRRAKTRNPDPGRPVETREHGPDARGYPSGPGQFDG